MLKRVADDTDETDHDHGWSVYRLRQLMENSNTNLRVAEHGMGRGCQFTRDFEPEESVAIYPGIWSSSEVKNGFAIKLERHCWLDAKPFSDQERKDFCASTCINHRCKNANLRFQKTMIAGHLFVIVIAKRRCATNEWASLDYGPQFFADAELECECDDCAMGDGESDEF